MNTIVAPSLLSCDFARIAEESSFLNSSEADWFHLDVMDGVFVPNISFGFPLISAFRQHTGKPLDVHAMIKDVDPYISDFKKAGADHLTVHVEACTHLHRTIQAIRNEGMKAGVALNPHTPVSALEYIIGDVDIVCVMSVNPGFGGQRFIEGTYAKVRELAALIGNKKAHALIQVDGGVTIENAGELVKCGVNVLVAGNTVFKSDNPAETISRLKRA